MATRYSVVEAEEKTSFTTANGTRNMHEHEKLPPECGTPKCLQVGRRSMLVFMVAYSISIIINGASWTYRAGLVTALEKHFKLSSAQVGFLATASEISRIPTLLFLPHLVRNFNRAKVLALGSLVSCLSNFLFLLPHLIFGYDSSLHSANSQSGLMSQLVNSTIMGREQYFDLCSYSGNNSCMTSAHQDEAEANTAAYGLFVAATMISGIAYVPEMTLVLPYIDDHVPRQYVTAFFGAVFAVVAVGFAAGYFISGLANSIFIDMTDPGFGPEDPRWMSAWWLGFAIFIPFFLIISSMFMLLPDEPIRRRRLEEKRDRNGVSDGIDIKGYIQYLKRILTNIPWIALTLLGVFEAYLWYGLLMFMPKYLENAFDLSPSFSGYLIGGISGGATLIGSLVGGLVASMKQVGERVTRQTTLALIGGILATIAVFALLFLGCDQVNIAGKAVEGGLDVVLPCNSNCSCSTSSYQPVCGDNGLTYFSACHAGCTGYSISNITVYTDCSCVGSAVPGVCPKSCDMFIPFITVASVALLISVATVPSYLFITMRIVAPADRARGSGLSTAIQSLLGELPRPTIMGAAIDTACIVWGYTCGLRGNCWVYDVVTYRYTLFGVVCSTRLVAVLLLGFMLFYLVKYGLAHEKEEKKDYIDNKDSPKTKLDARESVC